VLNQQDVQHDCRVAQGRTGVTRDIQLALRKRLADRIGADRFELWFERYGSPQLVDDVLRISAPDSFTVEWIRNTFHSVVSTVAQSISANPLKVEYLVSPTLKSALPEEAVEQENTLPSKATLQISADTRPTVAIRRRRELDEMVVGDNNRMAVTTAKHLLNHLGEVTPLFVAGPTGCGKSHLLTSIYRDALASRKAGRCVHLSAEQFTSHFLEALHGRGLPSFRAKHRDVDLLVIDDIHFLAGKRATLVEFQHTLDQLLRAGRQIVVSANRPPTELTELGGEIIARLSQGLVCSMDYPQADTKLDLVRTLADRKGLTLPDEITDVIGSEISGDARRISGALNRLLILKLAGTPCETADSAREHLKDLLSASQPSVGIHEVEQAVCDAFGIESDLLKSSNKSRQFSQPRMLAMYLARRHTRAALSEIGDYFGGRSHSTVVAAQKTVDRWVESEKQIGTTRRPLMIHDAIRQIERRLRAI
jgi:chromosomal replication initiator protein